MPRGVADSGRSHYTEYNDIMPLKRAADDYARFSHLQYFFMDDHRELAEDVYLTRYSSGEEMVTNYSGRPYEWRGTAVAPGTNRLFEQEMTR